jgi:hypothetical protein
MALAAVGARVIRVLYLLDDGKHHAEDRDDTRGQCSDYSRIHMIQTPPV